MRVGPIDITLVDNGGFRDVHVAFDAPVASFAVSPIEARRLARAILDHANQADTEAGERPPLEVAERALQEIGRAIADMCPRGYGFVLCLSSYKDGASTYSSNIDRKDAAGLLRSTAQMLEKAR